MLEVTDIHVAYGDIEALRGVSLTVEDGEMVALIGTNGAGKTTTLRAITGLMAPWAGEITFDGEAIGGLPAYDVVDRGVAHLPEGRELFSDLSVMDNLRLGNWSRRRSGSFKERVNEVMDHFPILRDRSGQAAGTLSGGEQQMLGVARALMSDPKLLVVDELSLGLAPKIVSQLFDILRAVNAEGTSVLLVEQFVHMALANTNRAYALAKGEVVLDGDSAELAESPELMDVYLGGATGSGGIPADAGTEVVGAAAGRSQNGPSENGSTSRESADGAGPAHADAHDAAAEPVGQGPDAGERDAGAVDADPDAADHGDDDGSRGRDPATTVPPRDNGRRPSGARAASGRGRIKAKVRRR